MTLTPGVGLHRAQVTFAHMLGHFLVWCEKMGHDVTLGEVYRPEREAKADGFVKTLHTQRLAVDLNFFIKGELQTDSKAYEPLGKQWESQGGSWGGRFTKPDGNHFSLAYEGVR